MSDSGLTASKRIAVAERASWCCEYCCSQARFSPDPFSVEHVLPRSRGGKEDLSNLAFSCQGCNNYKHVSTQATDPATGALAALFHPRQDRWEAHFRWSEDKLRVIGLTATGRATITKLKLNRPGVVNLRTILRALGRHPAEVPTHAD
jgi:HNH endonuclease